MKVKHLLWISPLLMAFSFSSSAAYPTNYSCSAKSYTGKALNKVTVYAGGQGEAKGKAMGLWRGKALFHTIQCNKK
ncbi:hypothetical protein [Serratia sp. AKBS12]|uniref:hypothetical protein n=1 Tax=Serratia sp. AKBS12 TaxID=2974597 RepID=UPI0021662D70|nr:hypothetical protein [Serratia sp. AKBS12]MCS3407654.1 hypothetical protein [Serratia sp. AKBS12]HEI8867514.1 hypothetical protein [Serratia odorifera]